MPEAWGELEYPYVVLGEVHTGLVANQAVLTRRQTEELLGTFALGEPVLSWERPIAHTQSGTAVTGLDCTLAVGVQGARARAVGTVVSRVAITGGTVLQGSTVAAVGTSAAGRREDWSHYTARPGVLETLTAQPPELVAEGFLGESGAGAGHADFWSICDRIMLKVQKNPVLKGDAPLPFQRTSLRWAACVRGSTDEAQTPTALLRLGTDLSRTLRLGVAGSSVAEITEFCDDLAMHDWILTTLIERMEKISEEESAKYVRDIRPLISHLLHLWMPAARVNTELSRLWAEFERSPGFSRQWASIVTRIRDQISLLGTLEHWVLINNES